MKSVSFMPKTIPAGGSSRSPLDRLSVDWHHSKRSIFILILEYRTNKYVRPHILRGFLMQKNRVDISKSFNTTGLNMWDQMYNNTFDT